MYLFVLGSILNIANRYCPLLYLLLKVKQEFNTCIPIPLVCKFGSSVTFVSFGLKEVLVPSGPWRVSICYIVM